MYTGIEIYGTYLRKSLLHRINLEKAMPHISHPQEASLIYLTASGYTSIPIDAGTA